MVRLRIVCVGSLKEKYLEAACGEYLKRLTRFAEVTVRELKEERLPAEPSPAEVNAARAKESARILAELKSEDYVVAADVMGKEMTSQQLSEHIQSVMLRCGSIAFVIGGSDGFDDTVRSRANLLLSASRFTFPHQLFRVLLLEQLYRSFKIMNGEKYHK